MSEERWYRDGLRFSCTQCGHCCSGGPGHVWVNGEEIAALARAVGEEDVDRFERLYVRKVGIRKSLKELPNYDCVFLDTDKRVCTVYEARPRQCRTWPFWESNLKDEESWRRTCEVCPGSGRGQLYSLELIEEQRQVVRV